MENFYSKLKFLWIGMAMFFFMVISVQGFSQDRSVSGTVTSEEDGSTIPGVSIIVTGTNIGTISDLDGNYKLDVPEGSSLTFSSVGYVSHTVEVGSQSVIDMVLMIDVRELSEVVVIGYGTREKKDLTGAISTMDAQDIEKTLAFNPEMAMQGQMAGVLVTTPSGLPTDRPEVRIRGVSTFGIADPLYVIDGVPITEFGSGAEQSEAVVRDIRGNINVLSMINPNDIESISVLKDASAAAIYGVRASNGVILINTKKGKMERAKVDISFRYGVSNLPNTFNMLQVPDYTSLYQESFGANPNFTLPGYFNPDSVNAVTPYQSYLGDKPTIDWQDPFINQNAPNIDASARIYGGTESTSYYVSLGYSYIESPIITNNQERFSLATNLTSKVAKWMDVGVTYRVSLVDVVDRTPEGGSLTNTISAPPWQPIMIEDDFYRINSPVEDWGYATTQDSTTSPNPDHPMWGGTNDDAPPYLVDWQIKYGDESWINTKAWQDPRLHNDEYRMLRNIGNVFMKLNIYKGLSIKGSLSLDYYHNQRSQWNHRDMDMFNLTPGNPWVVGGGDSYGSIRYRDKYDHNFVKELVIDWIESFGDHNINVTLSAMDQQYGFRFIQTGTSWVQQEEEDKRYIVENQEYTSTGEWLDESALQGYMARASYNYASKYYLDATVRRDGSSKFAPDYRWGTFPSFALAWRMSAENFMSGASWLNDLKWRAGWGQLGNQETASFAWLSGVNRSPQYAYGSGLGNSRGSTQNGLFLPDFPTEDLSWETTTTLNIGFDAIYLESP